MSQSNVYIFIRKVHGLNVSREDNLKKNYNQKHQIVLNLILWNQRSDSRDG